MKRVPLKPSAGGLRRTGQLRPRSAKTAKLYRQERAPLVARLLEERPVCQRCDRARADDVHELKSRARGGSITDVANLVTLCRPCHELVTAGGDLSFLRHSWEAA